MSIKLPWMEKLRELEQQSWDYDKYESIFHELKAYGESEEKRINDGFTKSLTKAENPQNEK